MMNQNLINGFEESIMRGYKSSLKNSNYEARISRNKDNTYYAIIVRVDKYGEHVIHSYKGRHFKTLEAANNSTGKYIRAIKEGKR